MDKSSSNSISLLQNVLYKFKNKIGALDLKVEELSNQAMIIGLIKNKIYKISSGNVKYVNMTP